jgi:diketogulonate reductase-like aldo/keto reductase
MLIATIDQSRQVPRLPLDFFVLCLMADLSPRDRGRRRRDCGLATQFSLLTNRTLKILALMRTARTSDLRSAAVPLIMYGTAWKEDRTQALALEAIAVGFRAFDTANQRKHYVEEGVGAAVRAAIASGIVKREDLFLQTKFTYQRGQDHRLPYNPDCDLTTQVRQSIASSLEHLGVTRIDSYILHGPSQRSGLSQADGETWRAMEDAADEGLVGLLGISNVAVDQLKALLCAARIRPTFVQNRCLVRASWDHEMHMLCQKENIIYQAFSLLSGNRQALLKPCVIQIAHHYNKTVPQVVYRFAFELGMLPLTGTTDVAHMRDSLDIFDFTLTHDEIETLLALRDPG